MIEDGARILVGTDFSEGAGIAIDVAREFAMRFGASLDVLHVLERYGSATWQPAAAAAEWLERKRIDRTQVTVRSGFPWVELVRHAEQTKPLMIVVGSHGTSGFQPLTLGSTAARMGVLSPYPVLVVAGAPGRRRAPPPPSAART